MKVQNYILPVFVCSNIFCQTNAGVFPNIQIGFSHSTFTGMCFTSSQSKNSLNKESKSIKKQTKIAEVQYGFGIGLFLWMPLNERVVFKPKLEGTFSNSCLKQNKSVYSTCFDLNISHSFAVAFRPVDENGVINVAKNMSCYLTSKQSYLLIGPNINLKKFDTGYTQKGYQNQLNLGFIVGYGINYEFHGTNVTQEITYGISSTAQNQINDSKKIAHTLTLAINFY